MALKRFVRETEKRDTTIERTKAQIILSSTDLVLASLVNLVIESHRLLKSFILMLIDHDQPFPLQFAFRRTQL